MEDKNLLALEISRLKEIIKGLDGQRQLAVRTTLEIKAAERRGAQRMIDVLKCKKPFIDNGSFTTICDHCMASMKIWDEWEKTQEKPS